MGRPATRRLPEEDLPHAVLRLERGTVTVASGPDAGRSAALAAGETVAVGTEPANDLVLTDDSVSARHLVIAHRLGGFVVRDTGSTNGTWLDGLRVLEAPVAPGASIRAGTTHLTIRSEAESVALFSSQREEFQLLCGRSRKMRELFGLLERIAPTATTVLMTGETGTGKELAARSIHLASPRAGGPFVVFDCGRAARDLVESELFGHERGAFTGALERRSGVFEQADRGTLFIDEVGELPLELQPKLLRVLEERLARPLGGSRALPVDVRVIAATHRDLEAMVREGRFREDLYYRLAVVVAELPPLRQRLEDLPMLVDRLLARGGPGGIEATALAALAARAWRGNVRELANVLERARAFAGGGPIEAAHLAPHGAGAPRPVPGAATAVSLREVERETIVRTLAEAGNNKAEAARRLGIASSTLFEKMRRMGIGK